MEQKKSRPFWFLVQRKIIIIIFPYEIQFDYENIQQNSIYPLIIALAKLSVLANVPDSDPAIGLITDCQSTPPAIFFVLVFFFDI